MSTGSFSKIVGPAKPGESAIYRGAAFPDQIQWLPVPAHPEVNNLWSGFAHGLKHHPTADCLGERTWEADGSRGVYKYDNYETVNTRVQAFASGLRSLGFSRGDRLGIYSINRKHYTLALLSAFSQSMVAVPLYDTLGAEAVQFIVNHSELQVILVAKDKLKNVLANARSVSRLRYVICMEEIDQSMRDALAKSGGTFKLMSFSEVEAAGSKALQPPVIPAPDDLAYIMYTSGTTGDPKGVMLSHKNLIASIANLIKSGVDCGVGDVYISYLPLAHSMETVIHFYQFFHGSAVAYYQGDVKKLFDDIVDIRPTLMAGVPRVWSRIYDRVMGMVNKSGFLKRSLFKWGYSSQCDELKSGGRSAFWDSLIFNKTKARLGGRMRYMATGAAPISPHLLEFLKVVFGCPVLQGYGLTESAAASFITPIEFNGCGPVGIPGISIECKLVDVPEMDYRATDKPCPRGEICIRGPAVFSGYYKNEKETKEMLDADGWLHTGDVGKLNEDGTFSVIDRKKNIFKLAQGEYVAAEALENVYGKSKWVGQIWVYGNSLENELVAVVTPKMDSLYPWAKDHGQPEDMARLVQNPDVKRMIMEDMAKVAQENKLRGFEQVKEIHLEGAVNELGQGFTVENECLTPTFKLRRPQLLKHYKAQVDAMYAALKGRAAGH